MHILLSKFKIKIEIICTFVESYSSLDIEKKKLEENQSNHSSQDKQHLHENCVKSAMFFSSHST
jgi:hypothetical protein